MADSKVLFGMKNLYVGTMTDDGNGNITMGSPYHQAGAVGYNPEEQGDNYTFNADDTDYYSSYTSGTYEGDLTVAKFDDKFKKDFLKYIELDDGGLAQIKNAVKPKVYIAFEVSGDADHRRVIFYNVALGGISREYATIEDSPEVTTESIPTKVTGDNKTGISMVTYKPGDTGYDTLFSNPPAPTLPDESES